jgi:glutamyl-tRNA(Gln) amidotransferase subunit D
MNAVCAVEAAKADCAAVLVCMHASSSDDRCALHRGTRVRKNHTSRRDAFETVGARPLGTVEYDVARASDGGREGDNGISFRREHVERDERDLAIAPAFETDVELLKFTPGMGPDVLDAYEGTAGLVIEGTGLGHVHTGWIPAVASLVEGGTDVVMTSQCIEGRVCDRVYDTGRDLLDAGVIEGEDLLPGTAKVKLMWALANAESGGPREAEDGEGVAATMRTPLAGELTHRSTPWA